jgi:hypothetical protein
MTVVIVDADVAPGAASANAATPNNRNLFKVVLPLCRSGRGSRYEACSTLETGESLGSFDGDS